MTKIQSVDEIWLPVVGYEEAYEVSNLGNVRSLSGGHRGGKVLKQSNNKRGYLFVGLYKNGKSTPSITHRIVAKAFIPNPENKPQVNHKDGVRSNNIVTNLEWNTQSENIKHSFDVLGRVPVIKGRRQSFCRRGHAMIGDNVIVYRGTQKKCRECEVDGRRRRSERENSVIDERLELAYLQGRLDGRLNRERSQKQIGQWKSRAERIAELEQQIKALDGEENSE